jgi:hypothetical protein
MEDDRGKELAERIEKAERETWRKARRIERWIGSFWWSTIVLWATASGLGFVSPGLKEWPGWVVQPWMVSLVAAAAAGLEVVRRKSGWRGKSDAFYRASDRYHRLWHRFRYQMPKQPTPEQVCAIDRDYQAIRLELSEALSAVNKQVDEPEPKPKGPDNAPQA